MWLLGVSFGIIQDKNSWKILFQERQNTSFACWKLHLPGGHIDLRESADAACKREMLEELWIQVERMRYFCHHICWWAIEASSSHFFLIDEYTWTLVNKEPDRCKSFKWLDPRSPYPDQMVRYVGEIMELLAQETQLDLPIEVSKDYSSVQDYI